MMASILIWITICGCGDHSGAMASGGDLRQKVAVPKVKRSEMQTQKDHLKLVKKETRCMKAYLKDMQAQNQGVQPNWEQPELDEYMKQEICEPYLVNLKR